MRIAILYAGPYRGNSNIVENHLMTFGNSSDIYVSCFEHYVNDWKNSELPVKEYFITPKIQFNKTNWSKFRNDEPGQSGFWQFWNIKNVINNVPDNYDIYIKNRIDLVFSKKIDIIKIENNTIYSPNTSFHLSNWDVNNWINDELLVFDNTILNVIASFVTDFYNTQTHLVNDPQWSNEYSLRLWLKENNINVEKIHDFYYVKNYNGISVSTGIHGAYQLERD